MQCFCNNCALGFDPLISCGFKCINCDLRAFKWLRAVCWLCWGLFNVHLLRAAEKIFTDTLCRILIHFDCHFAPFLLLPGKQNRCKTALDRGFPFWPFFLSDVRLGANCASKTASDFDSGLPKQWFCLSRIFRRWRQHDAVVGPSTANNVAGWRGTYVTQGSGIWFHGAPLLCTGGLGGGGSATVERVTRGGSTTGKPPISWMLTIGRFGEEKTRPP